MAMPIEERRARGRAFHKAKNDAKAIAAGRVPGLIGHPRLSDDEREAARIRKNKKACAAALKRRTAMRATRAIAEGRIPGCPGKKRVLVTDEQRRAAACRRAKTYRDANLEKVRAADVARNLVRMPLLKEANPVAYRLSRVAIAAASRARQAGGCSPDGLTAIVRRVFAASGGKCAACPSTRNLELDHIVAVTNGGDNSEDNLQFLCSPCNKSKAAKDYDTWLQSRRLAA